MCVATSNSLVWAKSCCSQIWWSISFLNLLKATKLSEACNFWESIFAVLTYSDGHVRIIIAIYMLSVELWYVGTYNYTYYTYAHKLSYDTYTYVCIAKFGRYLYRRVLKLENSWQLYYNYTYYTYAHKLSYDTYTYVCIAKFGRYLYRRVLKLENSWQLYVFYQTLPFL